MRSPTRSRRHLPTGQVVAGVAVVVGLAAAVGLLMAGNGPDLDVLSVTSGTCSIWPFMSAAL
jgi:hypothetical protein